VAAQRIRGDGDEKGWGVDTKLLVEDDFAYALGARGRCAN
jgi:hypothetical protein